MTYPDTLETIKVNGTDDYARVVNALQAVVVTYSVVPTMNKDIL